MLISCQRRRRDDFIALSCRQSLSGGLPRSANRNAKDPHVVAACNHAGLFRREATAQHRSDKLYPLRVVLQAAGPDLLVAADADVIHADNVGHLLEPFDILFEARKKVPDSDRPSRFSDRPRVIAADLPAAE